MQVRKSRRDFLTTVSAAGAAGVLGGRRVLADEGPPETTTIRFGKIPGICIAPQYVAHELLRAEGFTEVYYVESEAGTPLLDKIAGGEVDLTLMFAAPIVVALDAGHPVTAVAGVHVGCFELFGHQRIRRIVDLKGQSVGVQGLGSSPHLFLASMATYVGLDPLHDIDWVTSP